MPSLDLIIVNWNSGSQLRHCLHSILGSECRGLIFNRVVVVDNASNDGSLEGIESLNLPLRLIRNQDNRGFAASCNQGARESSADYLLFLNPDTVLFRDSLLKPVEFMEQPENSPVGIVGIQLVDKAGNVSRTCARFPTTVDFCSKMLGLDRLFPTTFPGHFMTDWDHSTCRNVDQVMGAFFMVRRKLFEILGGFDESFFVYFEDLDFSLRARRSGWRSLYLTDARAYHKGCGTSERVKDMRLFYSLRSRILYGFKHFNIFAATGLMVATLVLEPFPRIVLGFVRGSYEDIKGTIRGFFMLWRAVPILLRSAAKYRKI
jgi:N-acetylglucosaminyl-diphospho-decaprenol L-rhamnosyltransferase